MLACDSARLFWPVRARRTRGGQKGSAPTRFRHGNRAVDSSRACAKSTRTFLEKSAEKELDTSVPSRQGEAEQLFSGVLLSLSENPVEHSFPDFDPVDLIKHFVSSASIEFVRDIRDARFSIALNEESDSLELLANGIFAAGKNINGQVTPDFAQICRITYPLGGGEKRFEGCRLKLCKA